MLTVNDLQFIQKGILRFAPSTVNFIQFYPLVENDIWTPRSLGTGLDPLRKNPCSVVTPSWGTVEEES
jgi:hypothetical protein